MGNSLSSSRLNHVSLNSIDNDNHFRIKNGIEFLNSINIMVEQESNRAGVLFLLSTYKPDKYDFLDYTNRVCKIYVDFCRNYGHNLNVEIKNDNKYEKQVIMQQVWTSKAVNQMTKIPEAKITTFIIADWVFIPHLLNYLKKKNKGEQHKLCHELVLKLKDNWNSTKFHNTNKSYNALFQTFKFLKIQNSMDHLTKDEKKIKYLTKSWKQIHLDETLEPQAGIEEEPAHVRIIRLVVERIKQHHPDLQPIDFPEVFQHYMENADENPHIITFDEMDILVGDLPNNLPIIPGIPIDEEQPLIPQMFGISSLKKEASDTIKDIRCTTQNINDTFAVLAQHIATTTSGIDVIADKYQETLTNINNIIMGLNNTGDGPGNHLIMHIAKILSFFFLIHKQPNQSITSLTALIVLILPAWAGNYLSSISDNLIRAIMGVINKFTNKLTPQAGEENESIFHALYDLLKMIVGGLFTDIPGNVFTSMKLKSSKVRVLSDTIRSCNTIFDFLCNLTTKIMEFIGDKIIKYYGILPYFMKDDKLTPLIDKYIDYKLKGYFEMAQQTRSIAQQLCELLRELIIMEGKLIKQGNINSAFSKIRVLPYVRVMITSLERALNKVPPHVKGTKNVRRCKPFWVYIFGEPRIGKSSMLQPLIVNALVKALKIRDSYEDPHNLSFFRNCGDDYWDQYVGQPVLQYNDLFQAIADDQRLHNSIIELQSVVDDQPYPVNMAECEAKNQTYMTSEIVVSNAQENILGQSWLSAKCWSKGTHLYARRAIVVELILDPHYKIKGGEGIDQTIMQKALTDFPNCYFGTPTNKLFPMNMYALRFYDKCNNNIKCVLDLNKGLDYICQSAIQHQKEQLGFKDQLFSYFEEVWTQAGDEDFKTPPTSQHRTTMDGPGECDCLNVLTRIEMLGFTDKGIMEDLFALYKEPTHICTTYDELMGSVCDRDLKFINETINRNCELRLHQAMKEFRMETLSNWDIAKMLIKNTLTSIKFWGVFGTIMASTYLLTKCIKFLIHSEPEVQSHEGNNKRPKQKIVRRLKQETLQVQPNAYDQQNFDIEAIIKTHFARVQCYVEFEKVEYKLSHYGHIFCIGGDVFAMPKHYWDRYMEFNELYTKQGGLFYLKLNWTAKKQTPIYMSAITAYIPPYEHQQDLIYIRIKDLIAMRDLRKFFISCNNDPNLTGCYLYGMRSKNIEVESNVMEPTLLNVGTTTLTSTTYHNPSTEDPYYKVHKLDQHDYTMPICYKYQNPLTVIGDCGMILIHTDSRHNCRRLLGMHTAGNDDIGVSCPMYVEDIDEALSFFKSKDEVVMLQADTTFIDFSNIPEGPSYPAVVQAGYEILGTTAHFEHPLTGKIKKIRLTIPGKTKISKSVVFDVMEKDFGPHKFEPARLSKFKDVEGNIISPLLKALIKMNLYSQMFEAQQFSVIVDHVAESIMACPSKFKQPRLLTEYEMINGMPGVAPLDLSTSPGFPYTLIDGGHGKKPWFIQKKDENDHPYYIMGDFLQQQVDEREQLAIDGLMKETIFIDTLKDETRPIEKVEQGKTRLFQVGPMCLTILSRKYMGYFIAHIMDTYIDGESAIGVNPNSMDWTLKVKLFQAISDLMKCDDCANFDASLVHQIACGLAEIMNKYYKDSKQNMRVRKVLILTPTNGSHVIEDIVIMSRQSNKSGTLITTVINNAANQIFDRFVYLETTKLPDLSKYHIHVEPWDFGDDNAESIHESIIDVFNSISMRDIMAKKGVTYTNSDKNKEMVPYVHLSEATFLKRKFIKHPKYDIYLAPLDFDVVMEIPRWSESDPTNMPDQMQRFNACLSELANYGEELFNITRTRFVIYCQALNDMGYAIDSRNLCSYNSCMSRMFPRIFDRNFKSDLSSLKVTLNEELLSKGSQMVLGKHCEYAPVIINDYHGSENLIVAQTQNEIKQKQMDELLVAQWMKNITPEKDNTVDTVAQVNDMTPEQVIKIIDAALYPQMGDDEYSILGLDEAEVLQRRCIRTVGQILRLIRPIWIRLRRELASLITSNAANPIILDMCRVLTSLTKMKDLYTTIFENWNDEPNNDLILPLEIIVEENVDVQAGDDAQQEQNEGVVVNVSKTTTYMDTNPHHTEMNEEQYREIRNMYPKVDLQSFLKRSYPVYEGTWSAGQGLGSLLFGSLGTGLRFPYCMTAIPTLYNHLQNIPWFAPDVKISIRMNSTQMNYGALAFQWLPQADLLNNMYKGWPACMSGRWYQNFPDAQQTLDIIIPYTNYRDYLEIGNEPSNGLGSGIDLFTLFGYVSCPLSVYTGTAGNVDYTIFAELMQPNVAAYTHQNFTPQSGDDGTSKYKNTPAYKMMLKQGWQPGSGLGKNLQGDTQTIAAKMMQSQYPIAVRDATPKVVKSDFWGNLQWKHRSTTKEGNPIKGQNSIFPQADDAAGEAEASTNKGIISETLKTASDFIRCLNPIPYVGLITTPVSLFIGAASYLIKWAGFSIPINLAIPAPMHIRQPRMYQTEEVTNSWTIGTKADLALTKDFKKVNGKPEELLIKNYCARPFLIYVGQHTVTQGPQTVLFGRAVTPRDMWYTDYTATTGWGGIFSSVGVSAITTFFAGPLYYISRMFRMWRGSMRYHIRVFSSAFQTTRLRIIYCPSYIGTYYANPTFTQINMQDCINMVIDVRNSIEYSFTIPYMQPTEWLNFPNTVLGGSSNICLNRVNCNGVFFVVVQNTLASGSGSATNPIYFQIFNSAGEDMQFAYPYTNAVDSISVIAPQAGNDDTTPCEYPSSSFECLQNKIYPTIGGLNSGYTTTKGNTSYEVTGIRQLLNMCSKIASLGSTLTNSGILNVNPSIQAPLTSLSWAKPMWYSYWSQIMPLFRYWRGGIRVMGYHGDAQGMWYTSQAMNAGFNYTYGPLSAGSGPWMADAFWTDTTGYETNGLTYVGQACTQQYDVTMPYFNVTNCTPTSVYGLGSAQTNYQVLTTTFMSMQTACLVNIYMGCADDFLVGWQMPIPRLQCAGLTTTITPRGLDDEGNPSTEIKYITNDIIPYDIPGSIPDDTLYDDEPVKVRGRVLYTYKKLKSEKEKEKKQKEKDLKEDNPIVEIKNHGNKFPPGIKPDEPKIRGRARRALKEPEEEDDETSDDLEDLINQANR